jgi:hypothetical protein
LIWTACADILVIIRRATQTTVGPGSMHVWTTSPGELKHVRTIMMCAAYFGGRRAKMELRSGDFAVGVIVSTNFGTDVSEPKTELQGEAAFSSGRMFGELHVLPDVGPVLVVQAIEIESIEPADVLALEAVKS